MNYKTQQKISRQLPAKKNLSWSEVGFGYQKCEHRFEAHWQDGQWGKGRLVKDECITLHEGSTALHYAQQCFEGMKAQTAQDGRILLFRPELNWQRMSDTAERLMMPAPSKELFLNGVCETVLSNYDYLPPFGYGASLYIRPFLIGIGPNLGIKKAPEYLFRVFASPVGPYYKPGQVTPITLAISQNDRVAARGIGNFKAGANYISGLKEQYHVKEIGADDILFLDPLHHRYIEEAGAANLIVYFKNRVMATPKANTILPSITRRSAMTLAKDMLNLETQERAIDFYEEVENISEIAGCGTATVIAPIGSIIDQNKRYDFCDDNRSAGPVMTKLLKLLTDIQLGIMEDPYGWNFECRPD